MIRIPAWNYHVILELIFRVDSIVNTELCVTDGRYQQLALENSTF
jgi:hypothetical protein